MLESDKHAAQHRPGSCGYGTQSERIPRDPSFLRINWHAECCLPSPETCFRGVAYCLFATLAVTLLKYLQM